MHYNVRYFFNSVLFFVYFSLYANLATTFARYPQNLLCLVYDFKAILIIGRYLFFKGF